ncbi:MAG: rhodanese-like domain-containing protein [Campylobacterales bacterium]|nr:rhodanese-like domain-containing protein [Campylobacterales bacterium]
MQKKWLLLSLTLPLLGSNIISLQYKGVEAEVMGVNGTKTLQTIEREIDPACLNVSIDDETIWQGKYAASEVPNVCKAEFVSSVGQIQPMRIDPEVETFGELEVLDFIEKMQKNPSMLLIDSRNEDSYSNRTIPGAVNLPHTYLSEPNTFPEEYLNALVQLGVKIENKVYRFDNVKTITVFCNASWCAQSPQMIKSLLKIGYPPDKIKWYRGGMQDWLALNMTSRSNHQGK